MPTADEVGDVGAPADGVTAVPRASDQVADAGSGDAGSGDAGTTDAAAEGDLDDDLFDPLLSDEPIDLAAVRADDALIDALGGGDLAAAHDLIDADDPLIAMLAAWAASARPDEEPEPECSRPALRLVGTSADEVPAEDVPADDVPAEDIPTEDMPAEDMPAVVAQAGSSERTDEDAPPVAPEIPDPAADVPGPAAAAAPAGTLARLVPPPVLGILDRARVARRRRTPADRPPAGYPLRRAAVAAVVAVLGVSAVAAAGGTARPGEASFAITRVFFGERAESLEAARVVADGLERARVHIAQRQPALAAQELADVENRLPEVRDEEGHGQLVGRQKELADDVALTLPAPPEPPGTGPTTRDDDPDTSILAGSEPPATVPDATTPGPAPAPADAVTPPSEDAPDGAPTPGANAVVPGVGTSGTPPEVVAPTVSGAGAEGTVTAEPPPVTGSSGDGATTTVTATSAPTDPPGRTSGTTTPTASTAPTTSSSTPAPPAGTAAKTDDGGTVATGSVPADGAPGAARPAARRDVPDDPAGAGAAQAGTARATRAAGSVTAAAPHHAPVVITTVPRPARGTDAGDTAADADAAGKPAAPAGARLSGAGEARGRAAAEDTVSRGR